MPIQHRLTWQLGKLKPICVSVSCIDRTIDGAVKKGEANDEGINEIIGLSIDLADAIKMLRLFHVVMLLLYDPMAQVVV